MPVDRTTQKTPEEFVNEIKTVLSSNVSKSIQLMTRANDLIKNTVQNASSQDASSIADPETLERWLNFNVAAYSVISDHTLSLLDKLITVAEGAMVGEIPGAADAEGPVDIEVTGKQGERCSAVFAIQHQYEQDLGVSFEATPLIADGALPMPSASVSFDPSSTALPPGNPSMIKVHVDIGKDFVPGKTYVTNIHVLGYESKPLVLSVNVVPSTESAKRAKRTRTRDVKKTTAAPAKKARASRGRRKGGKGSTTSKSTAKE